MCVCCNINNLFLSIFLSSAVICPCLYDSEIFPNKTRGHAMSVATFAMWLSCAILTISFPFLNKAFGASGTFGLYSAICILGFFYVLKKLPETKGKSLEQIENELVKGRS